MDVKKLNMEIVSCRPAVRKSRIAVMRKLIRQMKTLNTCKVESVKEKNLEKSGRLFEKVQVIKKIKDDEVTKFALRNKNLDVFLKEPKFNLKLNTLACMARYDAVLKKVNDIREKIPNWERDLPHLLYCLEKQTGEKVNSKENLVENTAVVKWKVGNVSKSKGPLRSNPKAKTVKDMLQRCEFSYDDGLQSDGVKCLEKNGVSSSKKEEKIDDPFFIEKKVIAPKLVKERFPSGKNGNSDLPRLRDANKRMFHSMPFKAKKDSIKIKTSKPLLGKEEEKLHPSWAAKKVKLIKPFQGKKIKFSDD